MWAAHNVQWIVSVSSFWPFLGCSFCFMSLLIVICSLFFVWLGFLIDDQSLTVLRFFSVAVSDLLKACRMRCVCVCTYLCVHIPVLLLIIVSDASSFFFFFSILLHTSKIHLGKTQTCNWMWPRNVNKSALLWACMLSNPLQECLTQYASTKNTNIVLSNRFFCSF